MKITMYELLGMVKDGKAPKKIKWGDTKYTLYIDEDTKQKYYQDDECRYFFLDIKCLNDLNEEVEILEEEKKIPEKLYGILNPKEGTNRLPNNEQFMFKINEIIDYLQYLKSKGDE